MTDVATSGPWQWLPLAYPWDDVASVEWDLSDAVIFTGASEVLDDSELTHAIAMLPWGLRDRRAW